MVFGRNLWKRSRGSARWAGKESNTGSGKTQTEARPGPKDRLVLLLVLGGLAELIYVYFFVRPYPLLRYYATPLLDLGKIAGRSRLSAAAFVTAFLLLFALYYIGYRLCFGQDSPHWPWTMLAFTTIFSLTLLFVYPIGAAVAGRPGLLWPDEMGQAGQPETRPYGLSWSTHPRQPGHDPVLSSLHLHLVATVVSRLAGGPGCSGARPGYRPPGGSVHLHHDLGLRRLPICVVLVHPSHELDESAGGSQPGRRRHPCGALGFLSLPALETP